MIKAISIEQMYQEQETRVWFDVNGQQWGIADCGGVIALLDRDGCPVDDCNDRYGLRNALIPHYEQIAKAYCGEDTQFEIELA